MLVRWTKEYNYRIGASFTNRHLGAVKAKMSVYTHERAIAGLKKSQEKFEYSHTFVERC